MARVWLRTKVQVCDISSLRLLSQKPQSLQSRGRPLSRSSLLKSEIWSSPLEGPSSIGRVSVLVMRVPPWAACEPSPARPGSRGC